MASKIYDGCISACQLRLDAEYFTPAFPGANDRPIDSTLLMPCRAHLASQSSAGYADACRDGQSTRISTRVTGRITEQLEKFVYKIDTP